MQLQVATTSLNQYCGAGAIAIFEKPRWNNLIVITMGMFWSFGRYKKLR